MNNLIKWVRIGSNVPLRKPTIRLYCQGKSKQTIKELNDNDKVKKNVGRDMFNNIKMFFRNKSKGDELEKYDGQVTDKSVTLKKLINVVKPESKYIIAALCALGVSSLGTLIFPAVIGKMVDILADPNGYDQLVKLSQALVAVFFVGSIAGFSRYYLQTIATERIALRIRKDLFASIMKQEIDFFQERKTGELVTRLSTDTTIMSRTFVENVFQGVRHILGGLGGMGMLFYLSPKMAFFILMIVPPVAIGAVFYGRIVKKITTQTLDALASTTAMAEERISAIKTVRAFAQETMEIKNYEKFVFKVYQLARRVAFYNASWGGGVHLVMNLTMLSVLFFGACQVFEGTITSGELTSFLFYTLYVALAFTGISNFWTDFMKALGSSQRVFDLLDRKPKEDPGTLILPTVDGRIEFKGVHFIYPSRPLSPILSDFSLVIESGKTIALVGHSGSGKTTISSLLLKFYSPKSGSVLLDGVDVSKLDPKWLSNHISVVPQDLMLFSGTIFDNIKYGKPDATDEEIQNAAKLANAHDFIMNFKDGYQTHVGEKGAQLSGGQKQRIAFARAVIKNPSVLILDEATSNLDMESEYLILQALDKLRAGRTVIIIAHRLSTIMHADLVALLGDGKLQQLGTFDVLNKSKNPYWTKLFDIEKKQDSQV